MGTHLRNCIKLLFLYTYKLHKMLRFSTRYIIKCCTPATLPARTYIHTIPESRTVTKVCAYVCVCVCVCVCNNTNMTKMVCQVPDHLSHVGIVTHTEKTWLSDKMAPN